MTNEMRNEIFKLHDHGKSNRAIARALGIHDNSVRWVLNHRALLQREWQKRRDRGKNEYRCGKCGELGHNRRTCGSE